MFWPDSVAPQRGNDGRYNGYKVLQRGCGGVDCELSSGKKFFWIFLSGFFSKIWDFFDFFLLKKRDALGKKIGIPAWRFFGGKIGIPGR